MSYAFRLARYIPRFARYISRGVRRLPRVVRRFPVRRLARRMRKKTQNKIHTYVRWCDKDTSYPGESGPSQIVAKTVEQNLVYSFKLDNLINPSDFTNLYDAYKINKITMFLERASNDSGDGNQYPVNKKISVVWDDDADPLSGEDAYMEYSNCRRYNPIGKGAIKLVLYPKISTPILNVGGATNAFHSIPANKNWLKIENDDVPHFGVKIHIPAYLDMENELLFNVRVKFHLSMKGAK